MKILVFDCETAPKVAYVWRFFKENISAKQVKEHGHIMSFAAKWLGEKEIFYCENRKDDDAYIISQMCALLDEADAVIAHNGEEFDMKQVRARAVVNGIKPPSPVKVIDTKKIAKREFGFPSNSLEYLTKVLDCEVKKTSHGKFAGFELWSECLKGNDEAWAEMKSYNIDDVLALESLYYKLRGWDTKHPNLLVYRETPLEGFACPKCGSYDIQKRGFAYTSVGTYQRFVCKGCGGWSRSRKSEKISPHILVNQVN